jgi:hypothetical protein
MGARAGAAWRECGAKVPNPFHHPALRELAAIWRSACLAAAGGAAERDRESVDT